MPVRPGPMPIGAEATVFVDDRVAAFAADERAATVLDAAEAATLLDPNARGRRAPATGDATVAPGSRPPSSSDAGTAATVPPPGVRYVREAWPARVAWARSTSPATSSSSAGCADVVEVAHDRRPARASCAKCR